MSTARPLLRLEDKLAAEERLLERLGHRWERRVVVMSVAAALAVHGALLFVPAPRRTPPAPGPIARPKFLEVVRWIPRPAGQVAPAAVVPAAGPGRNSEPDAKPRPLTPPTLAQPEPVAEPTPFDLPVELPHEAETLGAAAAAVDSEPAADPPLMSPPSIAPGGSTRPKYPLMARALRAQGFVLVEVRVGRDGSVAGASVVRCSRPGVGFEEAAVAAVRKWTFNPGLRGGEAVESTLVVKVEFTW